MESSVINERKSLEQSKALNKWATSGFIGSIIAGTGFGKSRCGVVAVNHVLNVLGKKNALILVPTIQLQDQFVEEFNKWGYENCLDRVEILCYQTAYKFTKKHYDIVICDEIHLGLSKEYIKFFKNNTYDKLLCMTATVPDDVR
jgi:superfamily II DNA or RNA helicase